MYSKNSVEDRYPCSLVRYCRWWCPLFHAGSCSSGCPFRNKENAEKMLRVLIKCLRSLRPRDAELLLDLFLNAVVEIHVAIRGKKRVYTTSWNIFFDRTRGIYILAIPVDADTMTYLNIIEENKEVYSYVNDGKLCNCFQNRKIDARVCYCFAKELASLFCRIIKLFPLTFVWFTPEGEAVYNDPTFVSELLKRHKEPLPKPALRETLSFIAYSELVGQCIDNIADEEVKSLLKRWLEIVNKEVMHATLVLKKLAEERRKRRLGML